MIYYIPLFIQKDKNFVSSIIVRLSLTPMYVCLSFGDYLFMGAKFLSTCPAIILLKSQNKKKSLGPDQEYSPVAAEVFCIRIPVFWTRLLLVFMLQIRDCTFQTIIVYKYLVNYRHRFRSKNSCNLLTICIQFELIDLQKRSWYYCCI